MTTSLTPPPIDTSYFAIVPKELTDPSTVFSAKVTVPTPGPSREPDQYHRYLRLPHPRNGNPGLYFVTRAGETEAILEVQSVSPERERSWFYGEQVISDGSLLLMTPINPKYLLIPLLISYATGRTSSSSSQSHITLPQALERQRTGERSDKFLPVDDLVEALARLPRNRLVMPFAETRSSKLPDRRRREVEEDLEDMDEMDREMERLRPGGLSNETDDAAGGRAWEENEDVGRFLNVPIVRQALLSLCESQAISSTMYYRPSLDGIITWLRSRLSNIASVDTFEQQPSLRRGLVSLGLGPLLESLMDQHTEEQGVEIEVKVKVRAEEDERVLELARVRLAGDILGQYIEPGTKAALLESYDFELLDRYLDTQESLVYAASRPIQQSGQESFWDEGDLIGRDKKKEAAGLKRKASEKGSRAQESLKKVNTSKMPKLTTFFKKKTS